MRRGYLIIIVLVLSSLACVFINLATQAPTPTPTSAPAGTKIPTSAPVNTQTAPSIPASTPTQTLDITAAPTSEEPTSTPYPTSVLDKQMASEINLIQTQVVEERFLQPKHPVPVVLLSPDEVRQNVVNDFLADYTDEEAADDVYELSAIGLLEPAFDMRGLMINLLSEQIAGYYDPDVAEMFVVQGQGFQGPERLTYSHEYTHVLQDQNYDIRNGLLYGDDTCEVDTERCAAIQALLEGDATLSEAIWYQYYSTDQDKQQISDYYSSLKSPVYDSAPAFLKDDFVFPYNQGATFVQDIFSNGGWSAIDAAYRNPPVTTEQILHPNLYPTDKPIPVDLPDLVSTLGDGWREVSRNQMGEWYTYLILARAADENARLDDSTAQSAAAGWGGDEYVLLHNDAASATVFIMKTVWDTTDDAAEFASSFEKYANTRFGLKAAQQGDSLTWSYTGGYTSLYHSGDTTIWITTPDSTTAQTITGVVQP
ncbi:MAG: hypothetical protein A2Z71_07315 [Chloroflexi bacterium RBG_13_50_21]|nr:MAG: hypothetical protein A2Z71_07315 [Chloroflexi bacterium RBG_13_50_21]